MKTLTHTLGPIALLLTLATPITLLAGPEDVAIQVNDAALTERDVAQFAEMMSGRQPANPMERQQVIEEMEGLSLFHFP